MFSYLGGKKFQAKWISGYFPKHDTYVEPFGGAFWVYFVGNINANNNVYNDYNRYLTNVFHCAKNNRSEFIKQLKSYKPQLRNLFEKLGITTIALSDTIGAATATLTNKVFQSIIPALPKVEFGAHMHVNPKNSQDIIVAAYDGGCRRFDSAVRGFGGCPMAKDELVGNLPTEKLIDWLNESNIQHSISLNSFQEAYEMSQSVFA
jgi:isopropylmalate/homocitrate/citramalate synthase